MASILGGLLWTIMVWFVNVCDSKQPVIKTKLGEIHGKSEQVTSDETIYSVNQYLGIPYAEPPIGELRFRKPVPLSRFNSPINASEFGHICTQLDVRDVPVIGVQSEDCLYLNVYVPDRSADMPSGHAVMIFIHGGSFTVGASNDYDGTHLAVYGNVISVSINYRLGALGFLSTMDDNCPGNFGLWDQRLAFTWVKENIRSFGGDSNRVTLFGQSSGGIAAVIHGMSPVNQGLFQRIIAESGVVATAFVDISRNAKAFTETLARKLNCEGTANAEIMDCMRQQDLGIFMIGFVHALNEGLTDSHLIKLGPVIDHDFIKQDLKKLYNEPYNVATEEIEQFRSLDFMNGFNECEGGMSMYMYINSGSPEIFRPSKNDILYLIPQVTNEFYNRRFSKEINELILHEYINCDNPYAFESIRIQYSHIHGDLGFGVPAVITSRLHAFQSQLNQPKVYMYKFRPAPTIRSVRTPSWLPGANHWEELPFVFGSASVPNATDWEKQLSFTIMKYWSNFAKTGNPNTPDGSGPTWQPYTNENQHYMELDKNMGAYSSKQYLLADKTHFWQEVLPGILRKTDNTDNCTDDTKTSSCQAFNVKSFLLIIAFANLMACFLS